MNKPDRLLNRRADKRSGVPYITTTVRIYGEKQIGTFERMCEATGRLPHELASDIVLDELWDCGGEPAFRRLAREQRQWWRARLRELARCRPEQSREQAEAGSRLLDGPTRDQVPGDVVV